VTRWKDKPFALVGVHVGGLDAKGLKAVMVKERLNWRSFVDAGAAGAGPIAKRWNLSATPTFFVIDGAGVIRRKWAGPPGELVLDAVLERLIDEAEKGAKRKD
jgi:hypothetical protein